VKRRAVIFDDNDLIRFTLWRLFDQRGYEVFTFPGPGLCPLHLAHECPCPGVSSCADLIISDVNMFGESGIEFIEKLLGKGCKQRRFALMSGSFSAADLARAKPLGCKLFIKPIKMEEVVAWVEEVEGTIPEERILYDWA
jgi:DNA-binding response OmpR family regulator